MNTLTDLLSLVFIQRALIAGLLLATLAGIVGIMTLIRKTAFYGDAVAHSSLAGVAIGLAFGVYPLFTALIYSVIVALALPSLKKRLSLSLDNILGILLPFSMGIGVLIFSLLPGYQPEMMSFLFGNILTIQLQEIYLIIGIFITTAIIFWQLLPQMLATSLDEEYATLLGLNVKWLQRLYEVLLTIIIVAGVKLLGVILINALLIIPASAAKNLSSSLKLWLILSPIFSVITVLGGIISSVLLNTPPGATIAVFSGVVFVISQIYKNVLTFVNMQNKSISLPSTKTVMINQKNNDS
ncbi:metal ABC transporter permease [Patescibacteria group bacterium]|nr:metal ABC transporter permease [Patescibacteria group bacterium]